VKDQIHPVYRDVVFQDMSTGFKILTRSTAESRETVQWEDGNEYPIIKLEVTSDSHPFFTGQQRFVDTEGRVERFMKRYQRKK